MCYKYFSFVDRRPRGQSVYKIPKSKQFGPYIYNWYNCTRITSRPLVHTGQAPALCLRSPAPGPATRSPGFWPPPQQQHNNRHQTAGGVCQTLRQTYINLLLFIHQANRPTQNISYIIALWHALQSTFLEKNNINFQWKALIFFFWQSFQSFAINYVKQ